MSAVFSTSLDCKTVRIFAYSSAREQSNKRSGTKLKTESETGERRYYSLASHALRACEARALRARKTRTPRFTDFFTDFEKKTYCVAVYHILSILLIGSDTASRVAEAMIGAKVRILCVRVFLLCFSNLALELVPRIFRLFTSRKPG